MDTQVDASSAPRWWAAVRHVYAENGDLTHAASVTLARERASPSVAELRVRIASLSALLRKIWRDEQVEQSALVELAIRRLAADAAVAVERGASDPAYDESFDLVEEMLLGQIAAWLKHPTLQQPSTDLLLAFLTERYGERAAELVPVAADALLSFGGSAESRTPSRAIAAAVAGHGVGARPRRRDRAPRAVSGARSSQERAARPARNVDDIAVIRRQLEAAVADGESILSEPLNQGRWDSWVAGTRDLLGAALGDRWASQFDDAMADIFVDDNPYAGYGLSAAQHAEARLDGRNADVRGKADFVVGALRAIDHEMERNRVRPAQGTVLQGETFDFVVSPTVRAIALRDYEELRVAVRTVKARALLAGSVVEAVLFDALEQKGVAAPQVAKMSFHELIQRARTLQVITARTAKVADSLRDMRNLVHPAVELRDGRLRGADADAAVALMRLVLEDLRR